jgi:hypothetical protein
MNEELKFLFLDLSKKSKVICGRPRNIEFQWTSCRVITIFGAELLAERTPVYGIFLEYMPQGAHGTVSHPPQLTGWLSVCAMSPSKYRQ